MKQNTDKSLSLRTQFMNRLAFRLTFRRYQCGNLINKTRTKALEAHAVTTLQWAILGALVRNRWVDGIAVHELASLLMVSRQNLSAVLSRMEERKLLERVLNEKDNRSRLIRLTPNDRQHWEDMQGDITSFYEGPLQRRPHSCAALPRPTPRKYARGGQDTGRMTAREQTITQQIKRILAKAIPPQWTPKPPPEFALWSTCRHMNDCPDLGPGSKARLYVGDLLVRIRHCGFLALWLVYTTIKTVTRHLKRKMHRSQVRSLECGQCQIKSKSIQFKRRWRHPASNTFIISRRPLPCPLRKGTLNTNMRRAIGRPVAHGPQF